jgi:large subunit ribosomal protein L22
MATTHRPQTPASPPAVSRARLRHLPMAPRKLRAVADLVRGLAVGEALALLANTPRAGSEPLAKLIKSARDNAEVNPHNAELGLDVDALMISHLSVDGGKILWRWRPRAYGRASRIRKRSCHITVELSLS